MNNANQKDKNTNGTEYCVCCGSQIPKGNKYCVICGLKVGKPKTHYDRIKNMSIEELAEFMYSAPDKICFENCKKDTGNKFSCKFGEGVDTANCINCMKQYLESEADVAYG